MTRDGHPVADMDGPQDCGAFFLDAVGPYRPGQIHARWSDEQRPTAPGVEEFVEKLWNRRLGEAAVSGTRLWDGPLCRLIHCARNSDGLEMTLGPTSYRAFVGTNLHNAHLRYTHGPEVLANPLGVSAVVMTEDRYLLLGLRAQWLAYHAGRIHPIGGCVEPAPPGASIDPFAAMATELREELGLEESDLGPMICLGLIRDKHIVQPELIFDAATRSTVEQIRARSARSDGGEHSELFVLRNHPGSVVTFIESNLTRLTPVALAGLLLHGMHHWGIGWFASTRGYLRSLI